MAYQPPWSFKAKSSFKKGEKKGLLCWNLLVEKQFVERIQFYQKFICRESSCSKKIFEVGTAYRKDQILMGKV